MEDTISVPIRLRVLIETTSSHVEEIIQIYLALIEKDRLGKVSVDKISYLRDTLPSKDKDT